MFKARDINYRVRQKLVRQVERDEDAENMWLDKLWDRMLPGERALLSSVPRGRLPAARKFVFSELKKRGITT